MMAVVLGYRKASVGTGWAISFVHRYRNAPPHLEVVCWL